MAGESAGEGRGSREPRRPDARHSPTRNRNGIPRALWGCAVICSALLALGGSPCDAFSVMPGAAFLPIRGLLHAGGALGRPGAACGAVGRGRAAPYAFATNSRRRAHAAPALMAHGHSHSHSHDGEACDRSHGEAEKERRRNQEVVLVMDNAGMEGGEEECTDSHAHSHSHSHSHSHAPAVAAAPAAHSHDGHEHAHAHEHSHGGVPCTADHSTEAAPVKAGRAAAPVELSQAAMVRKMGGWLLEEGGYVSTVLCVALILCTKVIKVGVPILYEGVINSLSLRALTLPPLLAPVLPLFPSLANAPLASGVVLLILLHAAAKVTAQTLQSANDVVFNRAVQPAIRSLGRRALRGLLAQELMYHLGANTGTVTRVVERGLRGVQAVLSRIVMQLAPQLLELLMVSALIATSGSPGLAVIAVTTVVAYAAFTVFAVRMRLAHLEKMNAADNKATSLMLEGLLGYETVSNYNREEWEVKRYDTSLGNYQSAATRSMESLALLNWGQKLIESAGACAMLLSTAGLYLGGSMTLGRVVMLNALLLNLLQPLDHLGANYMQLRSGMVDSKGLLEILGREPALSNEGAPPLKMGAGAVSFRGVHFAYEDSGDGHGKHVLCGLDLEISGGQTVGVVGESGSGKSTLARLLTRHVTPISGSVCVDGQDLAGVSGKSLRDNVAVVLQDSALFDEDILYNIRYGKEDCTNEEALAAGEAAQLGGVVSRMEAGYLTRVGERGSGLSGGQRQRVALARGLVRDAGILILDEATSAVDVQTEGRVMQSLTPLRKGKTTVIIAHRLATVANADQIVVMHEGRVAERGPHEELLKIRGGRYAAMWAQQEQGFVTAPAEKEEKKEDLSLKLDDRGDNCGCGHGH